MNRRLLALLAAAALLAGCAAGVTKIAAGEAVVGERMGVPVDAAWNQLEGRVSGTVSAALWTTEGLPVDQLNFYVGLKDGTTLAQNTAKEQRPIAFKTGMQPHEVVALFESLYTRDGSTFKLDRLDAATFLGERGWRAQFTVVRKFDEVRLTGSAWGTVRNGELFAITFTAPALVFYPRQIGKIEQIAASARLLKG